MANPSERSPLVIDTDVHNDLGVPLVSVDVSRDRLAGER